MLRIYRRHLKACGKTSERYRRCSCPIYAEGSLGGETVRRSLDLTSWQAASELIANWNGSGKIGAVRPDAPSVSSCVERFFADAKARGLRDSTLDKLRVVLEKQLIPFCQARGIRELRQVSTDDLRMFRETWKDAPLSALKKLERLRGFFRFCLDSGWIETNPSNPIKPAKVVPNPTLPFTAQEVSDILSAIDKYRTKGIYGEGNRDRLKAMTLLLLHSGLRIGDAVQLRRDAVQGNRLFLYTHKTGQPVFLPLPAEIIEALGRLKRHKDYFFWTGNGKAKSAVADWQRSFRKLFALAHIKDGHLHRFRDTFAVNLLLKGVSLENVATLLGNTAPIVSKHYSPWVKARQVALEAEVRRTWVHLVA